MTKKSVDLVSLIRKLIKEYENTHDKLYFAFVKKNDEFVYTVINQVFLDDLKLEETDIVGKSLQDLKHLIDPYYNDMVRNYNKAWEGNPIFYYVSSTSNPDVFFVISLDPIADDDGKVIRVDGHCVPLNNKEINDLQKSLTFFKEHESISNQ